MQRGCTAKVVYLRQKMLLIASRRKDDSKFLKNKKGLTFTCVYYWTYVETSRTASSANYQQNL